MFNRGLSEGLLEEFEDGPCAVILRARVGAGLDVRLRNEAVNLYFRGRSMARILGRRRRPTKLEIHRKYLATDRIGKVAGRPSGGYLAFDVNPALAEDYVADLDDMIRGSDRPAADRKETRRGASKGVETATWLDAGTPFD